MPESKIHFSLIGEVPFIPAEREEKWFDSSFSQKESPYSKISNFVGELRFPFVDNGRYESKHPILDVREQRIGFMREGAYRIGYTYTCVYAANCFWI